jgi:squalene-hopene/tetraprenyl-beta-curcumene cyclase
LLAALRGRVPRKTAKELFPKNNDSFATQGTGVESIFAALFLATENLQSKALSPEAEQAFERMWSVQLRDGDAKGGFEWFSLKLDPWEMPESSFYGASLAALAVGSAPREYRDRPAVRDRVGALAGYLQREISGQPLHNRLMTLWASSQLAEALAESTRKPLIEEIWSKQKPDGSWSMESLGPWKEQAGAPHAVGDSSYATGFTTVVLEKAGVSSRDARLGRALEWLKAHQDPKEGYWDGESMNKVFPADSMMVLFMRDAATAYASMALLEGAAAKQ